jgi:hypothetical protein
MRSVVVLLAVAAAGCASAAPPTEKLASSEAALRGAQEVGAQTVPEASLHLKLAQEQIAQAKGLMSDGENDSAGSVLDRAKADAELALALARENETRVEAEKAAEQVRALRERISQ